MYESVAKLPCGEVTVAKLLATILQVANELQLHVYIKSTEIFPFYSFFMCL